MAETTGTVWTQTTVPAYTLATIGHHANRTFIVKTLNGLWRYVDSGNFVGDEAFRAGWDIVHLPE